MTISTEQFLAINVGAAANDGTGDTLRNAFIKVNDNFANITAIGFNAGNINVQGGVEAVGNITANYFIGNGSLLSNIGNSGAVLQIVTTEFSDVQTTLTTEQIPADDTIPQNTEGKEIANVSITPLSSTSNLLIEFGVNTGAVNATGVVCALFRDTTANAIFGHSNSIPAGHVRQSHGSVTVASGSTTPTTFKLRIGAASAVALTINGYNSARLFGGVNISYIKVTEIEP